jgi:hypothetical protein
MGEVLGSAPQKKKKIARAIIIKNHRGILPYQLVKKSKVREPLLEKAKTGPNFLSKLIKVT